MAGALAQYLNKLGDPTVFQFDAAAYRRDGFGARRQFAPLIAEANGKAAGCLPYHFGYDLDSAAPNLHDLDLYVVPGAKRITNVQFMRLPADAL